MHTFVVLIEDPDAAAAVADVIEGLRDTATTLAVCVPPVRGAAFFADAAQQALLDRWWGDSVPPGAIPVYLADYEDHILPWLEGLDGLFYMRCDERIGSEVAQSERIRLVAGRTADEFAARVILDLARQGYATGVSDAAPLSEVSSAADPLVEPQAHAPKVLELAGDSTEVRRPPSPFDLLAAMPLMDAGAPHPPAAAGDVVNSRSRAGGLLPFPSLRGFAFRRAEHDAGADADLAHKLATRGSTVVAVGSRKGGVGKTSHAAGVAILAGTVLDCVGQRAVIVDANVANPDAWGVLNLPPGAATVRDTVAALSANLDPPRPVHATTPALACYPESRESTEYSRLDIQLFVGHLRRSYALIVVDLSNRLPDPTGGPEAAAAAYWLEAADVVVLPTASSKQDFNGVLDYLEITDLPPAVVAYIVPRSRRNREHPLTRRYLAAMAERAASIVELPDEADHVRYAGLEGLPLDSVSRRLRRAYRSLTEAIASAAMSECT